MKTKLADFYTRLTTIYKLHSIEHLLDWDQQVCLPEKGSHFRADQLAFIASLLHKEQTAPAFLDLVDDLNSNAQTLSEEDAVNVRETKHKLDRERKLPARLVEEKARLASETYKAWTEARPNSDYRSLKGTFSKLLSIVREEASCNKVSDDLYDGLLDYYEPGGRIAVIGPLLICCAQELSKLLPEISRKQGDLPRLQGVFPQAAQEKFGKIVSSALGYSFQSGRIDTAPHPFQTTLGPNDFRITTRWDTESPFPSLYGIIHEAGHALYEMGLEKRWAGTPMGSYISLGIHESQSRFWENIVGRSRPFARFLHPLLGKYFDTCSSSSPEDVWRIINAVSPSLIRVEADEVTYTLHIVIRMELEQKLISGALSAEDLPDAWNQLYRTYLSLTPETDADGVLQDIHWFSGSFGYFPTYALGNLYGAMFARAMRSDLKDFDALIERGDFSPILSWLVNSIHTQGMRFRGPALIKKITGEDLTEKPFLEYIKGKFL